jgi:hypothetical protein
MEWEQIKFEDGVLEIQAKSWDGFVAYVADKLSDYRAYIFRGQREPEWKLRPSLDRIDGIKVLKNDTLSDFKEASRGRRGPSPPRLSDDEWWALGQHHGLKTTLLDWTASPFVAAFFAFATERDPKALPKNRIVYALAKQQIIKKTEDIKKTKPGTILTGTDAIEIISPQVDDNTRLVSQRGLFTKSLSINLEIEDWVRKQFKGSTNGVMIKIYIIESQDDRCAFLRFLNLSNINYLTLFPDLDGAAKYCNMKLEIDNY